MKLVLGRIVSILLVAGGWLVAGVRLVLDLVGYSTAPEDLEVAKTRFEQVLDLLLATPWWIVWGFAIVSTILLIILSWPRDSQVRSNVNSASESSPRALGTRMRQLARRIAEETAYARHDAMSSGIRTLYSEVYAVQRKLEKLGIPAPKSAAGSTRVQELKIVQAYYESLYPLLLDDDTEAARDVGRKITGSSPPA